MMTERIVDLMAVATQAGQYLGRNTIGRETSTITYRMQKAAGWKL